MLTRARPAFQQRSEVSSVCMYYGRCISALVCRHVRVTTRHEVGRSLPHASQSVRAPSFFNVHMPHCHGPVFRRTRGAPCPKLMLPGEELPWLLPPARSRPKLIAAAIEAATWASFAVLAVVVSTHSHDCDASWTCMRNSICSSRSRRLRLSSATSTCCAAASFSATRFAAFAESTSLAALANAAFAEFCAPSRSRSYWRRSLEV